MAVVDNVLSSKWLRHRETFLGKLYQLQLSPFQISTTGFFLGQGVRTYLQPCLS